MNEGDIYSALCRRMSRFSEEESESVETMSFGGTGALLRTWERVWAVTQSILRFNPLVLVNFEAHIRTHY